MIVRKFEARSMKEALELVKKEFGPEAIILQAKDHSQRFGLLGQGSVEITAAISEEALERKKLAERKLPDRKKQEFYNQPAKQQKEWVQRLLESYSKKDNSENIAGQTRGDQHPSLTSPAQEPAASRSTSVRYIDIKDEKPIFTPKRNSPLAHPEHHSNSLVTSQASSHRYNVEMSQDIHRIDVVEDLKKEIFDLKKIISELHGDRGPISNKADVPSIWLSLRQKLSHSGLSESFIDKLLEEARKGIPTEKQGTLPFVEAWLMNWLHAQVKTIYPTARVHIFIGAPGAGKTHLLLKWSTFLRMRENKKLMLVNADHFKLGANNQLRTYANILGVSFARLTEGKQWAAILKEDVDTILCDTFPLRLDDHRSLEELHSLCLHAGSDVHKHLVMNAAASVDEQKKWMQFAKSISPDSLSFAQVDESLKRGGIFERSYELGIPLFSRSYDPGVSSGFELVTIERLIDFILHISKNPLASATT